GEEELGGAVGVVVHERGGGAPGRVGPAGLARPVGERAVAVVVVERGAAEAGDEQIEVAVVVVVADRRPHAVVAQCESRLLGDVGEMQRPLAVSPDREIVPEEPGGRSRRSFPEGGAAPHAEYVQIACVVVVEERGAGAHLLGHVVLSGRAVHMRERQPGRRGGFDEGFPPVASASVLIPVASASVLIPVVSASLLIPVVSAFRRNRKQQDRDDRGSYTFRHRIFASSRSMAEASAVSPKRSASAFASVAHFTASSRWPARMCAVASANR